MAPRFGALAAAALLALFATARAGAANQSVGAANESAWAANESARAAEAGEGAEATPSPPPSASSPKCENGEEEWNVFLWDSNGDGWNGSEMSFSSCNGTELLVGLSLLNGSTGTEQDSVCLPTAHVARVSAGSSPGEVGWRMTSASGETIRGGSPHISSSCGASAMAEAFFYNAVSGEESACFYFAHWADGADGAVVHTIGPVAFKGIAGVLVKAGLAHMAHLITASATACPEAPTTLTSMVRFDGSRPNLFQAAHSAEGDVLLGALGSLDAPPAPEPAPDTAEAAAAGVVQRGATPAFGEGVRVRIAHAAEGYRRCGVYEGPADKPQHRIGSLDFGEELEALVSSWSIRNLAVDTAITFRCGEREGDELKFLQDLPTWSGPQSTRPENLSMCYDDHELFKWGAYDSAGQLTSAGRYTALSCADPSASATCSTGSFCSCPKTCGVCGSRGKYDAQGTDFYIAFVSATIGLNVAASKRNCYDFSTFCYGAQLVCLVATVCPDYCSNRGMSWDVGSGDEVPSGRSSSGCIDDDLAIATFWAHPIANLGPASIKAPSCQLPPWPKESAVTCRGIGAPLCNHPCWGGHIQAFCPSKCGSCDQKLSVKNDDMAVMKYLSAAMPPELHGYVLSATSGNWCDSDWVRAQDFGFFAPLIDLFCPENVRMPDPAWHRVSLSKSTTDPDPAVSSVVTATWAGDLAKLSCGAMPGAGVLVQLLGRRTEGNIIGHTLEAAAMQASGCGFMSLVALTPTTTATTTFILAAVMSSTRVGETELPVPNAVPKDASATEASSVVPAPHRSRSALLVAISAWATGMAVLPVSARV
mmetsp:Transcript_78224/g.253917  ORF Transcript_78224/g.253917 Transcript_78224/m.253917 type:complete len:819 (-) Transcript_78224:248-2704(-)